MPTFADGELGSSVRSKLNTIINTVEGVSGELSGRIYRTRADFVADSSRANGLADGDIVMSGGLFYEYSSGSTTISDLSGFVPTGTVQPEHFGAAGDGVTNDYADLAAFFSYLPGRVGALRQNATYRSDSKLTISGGGFTLHSNGATISFAAMNVDTTGSFLGLAGSAGSDISISSIVETVDSNNTVSVLVTTSSAHGLSVGDDVLLHSDDVIDIGHDATNERRGQLGYVTEVVSTTQFKILQPLYETLPTNPKMRPIAWEENFRFAGTLRLVGPGRRTQVSGPTGLNLTYCRDYEIEKIETIDVDSQAVVEESCTRGHTQHVHCEFPDQGGVTHEQYGLTWKNVVTDLRCDLLTGYRGKHLFDHTRNTNPGIGRNCRIGHIRAYGTWEAAAAMHGNARDCSIGFVETYNCLYGTNIRAPGWRIDDTYAEHCSEVVRLTDNPRRVSLGSVRGKNVTHGLRASDTVNGFIGTVEAGRISVDLVNVEECTGNAVHFDFSDVTGEGIPVFTEADAAVTGGTTTSVTFGDLPNAMYNNSGALTGAQLTIDPDGGGSAVTVSRVVTHTYSGGVNTLTWSSAIGTAPVAGVATYTVRSFVDDIEIGRVISKNTASADVYIFGNCRRVSIGEITATHDTVTATNALWLRTTSTIYPEGVSIGRMYIENKLGPLIGAEAQDVSFYDVSSDLDGNVSLDGNLRLGTGTGGAGTDTNMVTTGAASAWLNIKGGAGRAKITLGNDDTNIAAGSAGAIAFRAGAGSTDLGTEVARITSTGLGIGTIAPTEKLDLEGADGARVAFTDTGTRRWSAGNDGTSFTIRDESGAVDVITADVNGDVQIANDLSLSKHLYLSGGMSIDDPGYSRHHTLRDVAMYSTNSSSVTGAFVVQLGVSGQNTFYTATITIIRNYSPPVDVMIHGYYTSGGSWINYSCQTTDRTVVDTVRFARDGSSNPCVILSNNATPTSSTWISYVKVRVKDVTVGWTGADAFANKNPDNYITTLTTDISGYTVVATDQCQIGPTNVSTSTNDIAFYDDTGSQAVYFDASTSRLGVGITAPSYQLDVSTSLRIFGSSPQFVFKETDIGNQHRFIASSGDFYIQVMDSDLTNDGRLYLTGHNSDDAEQIEVRAGIFNVQSSSTSRLYVNASGNVGIGTTTPSVALEVNGSSIVQSTLQVNNLIRQATKTVATLPTSGVFAGDRSFVTDATATTFASVVAGGGSNKVPVYYDGTDWRIG